MKRARAALVPHPDGSFLSNFSLTIYSFRIALCPRREATLMEQTGAMHMTKISRRSLAQGTLGFAAAAVLTADLATEAAAAQPNMQEALRALNAALRSLDKAAPNKGGHRSRAMALVEQAIQEVRAGIAYAG